MASPVSAPSPSVPVPARVVMRPEVPTLRTAVVPGLRDEQVAGGVDSHRTRVVELGVAGQASIAGEAPRARSGEAVDDARRVDPADPVLLDLGYVQGAVRFCGDGERRPQPGVEGRPTVAGRSVEAVSGDDSVVPGSQVEGANDGVFVVGDIGERSDRGDGGRDVADVGGLAFAGPSGIGGDDRSGAVGGAAGRRRDSRGEDDGRGQQRRQPHTAPASVRSTGGRTPETHPRSSMAVGA